MSPRDIIYERLIQRNGKRSDLRELENAELGFSNDTSQLFIGSRFNTESFVRNVIIKIDPIPNVTRFITYILNRNGYSNYYITETLMIETESFDKANEIISFINSYVAASYQQLKPIARLATNIEVVTELNISDYTNPAYDDVSYNIVDKYHRPSKRILSKILTVESYNVFMEFNKTDVNYVKVEYMLLQDNGIYKRSGTMELYCDNGDDANSIAFYDEQNMVSPVVNQDQIRFNATVTTDKVRLTFTQPDTSITKIFYKVTRWGVDNVMELSEANLVEHTTHGFVYHGNKQFGYNGIGAGVAMMPVSGDDNDVTFLDGQVYQYIDDTDTQFGFNGEGAGILVHPTNNND